MKFNSLLFAGSLLASALFTASSARAVTVLTADNFSYNLKSSGVSSTLTASGTGFNFTINASNLIGPLVESYGAQLLTPILLDSAANPPVAQITIGGTTYTVLLTRTSASIATVPAGFVLAAGEPSTFSLPAVAQFQYTACVEFNNLPLCDPNFASPIADISIDLPGALTVSLTANDAQHNYSILSEVFVSTPEPATCALWALGFSAIGVWVRKAQRRAQ